MIQIKLKGQAVNTKKTKEHNVPSLMKATGNLVLTDLDGFKIKSGDTVNLYSHFPHGRVRKSVNVKYALDLGLLVPITSETRKTNTDL